jgi:hypothetical protein
MQSILVLLSDADCEQLGVDLDLLPSDSDLIMLFSHLQHVGLASRRKISVFEITVSNANAFL